MDPTPSNKEEEKNNHELIKAVALPVYDGGQLQLVDIITALSQKGWQFKNCIFSYFSKSENMFVYCGKEPSSTEDFFTLKTADIDSRLVLRVRNVPVEKAAKAASSEPAAVNPKSKPEKREHSRRNKERKIGDIIEKVGEWRALYAGVTNSDGTLTKLNLEDAAHKIGIAKKTLDDYLLQLRAGKKYSFDFHANKDSKVGVLRAFVKEQKKKSKDGKKSGSNPSDISNPSSINKLFYQICLVEEGIDDYDGN